MARQAAAVDAGELLRVEPRPGEVRDGGDGSLRAVVAAADGAAASAVSGEGAQRDEGVRLADRRRGPGLMPLAETIASLFAAGSGADKAAAREAFFELQRGLSRGEIRAAEPDAAAPTGWR